MSKTKRIIAACLASAAVCCFADDSAWTEPKIAAECPGAAAKADAGMQRLEGVLIERLDGQAFEKKDFNGTTAYVASLPTPAGINANVNVILDAQSGNALPSMDEYVEQTKKGYKTMMKIDITIKEQEGDTLVFTASNDKLSFFVKVIRDAEKSRFIVVTGTIVDLGGGEQAQAELKGIARKIERCVRSVRKEGSGTGAVAVTGAIAGIGSLASVAPSLRPTKSSTADAALQNLDWLRIERLDGQAFEKKSEGGTTMYVAEMKTPAELEATVIILLDTQHGNSLPTMEQYAQASKQEFKQKGLEVAIKEKDDASLVITASKEGGALFIKALKDVGNSRFVIVMGTIAADKDAVSAEIDLKGIAGKIERCVRSARLK